MRKIMFYLAGGLLLASTPALGYVGPGLGAGTLGVIVGFIGSIFLALFAVIWYPVKRLLKRVRGEDAQQKKSADNNDSEGGDNRTTQ